MVEEKKIIKEMTQEEFDNLVDRVVEQKLQEQQKVFNGKLSKLQEQFQEQLKEQIDKIASKPSGISQQNWVEIMKFIETNRVVFKDNLLDNFPCLLGTNFYNVKRTLLSLGKYEYVWFRGKKIKARFVFYGDNPTIQEAIKIFNETEWGREINPNCAEEKKTDVLFWISNIFKDAVKQNPETHRLMKGTVQDRRKLIRKLYPKI